MFIYLLCLSAALLCYTGFQNQSLISLIRSIFSPCSTCCFGLGFSTTKPTCRNTSKDLGHNSRTSSETNPYTYLRQQGLLQPSQSIKANQRWSQFLHSRSSHQIQAAKACPGIHMVKTQNKDIQLSQYSIITNLMAAYPAVLQAIAHTHSATCSAPPYEGRACSNAHTPLASHAHT